MMLLPKGTLLRVKESALSDDCANSYVNGLTTDEHGWLWFVEHITTRPRRFAYDCRSLATGEMAMWFDYEIETVEQADDT